MKITKQLTAIICLIVLSSTVNAQTNTFPSTGNVGVGNLSPQTLFHLSASSPTIRMDGRIECNSRAYQFSAYRRV